MTVRVRVEGSLLTWARERSRQSLEDLSSRFPHLPAWERGEMEPTVKQLEKFSRATHTPIGYLFLEKPPEEYIPIPDYRTIGDISVMKPSVDLLDTLYLCQQRQEWYRDFALKNRQDRIPFVKSVDVGAPVVEVARQMRTILSFDVCNRGSTWTEALKTLYGEADERGILVMVSGVVGSDTHRKLDPHEFRGFALVDDLAPVIFINGADTKAAQVFTLAHELAHIWLGESAISDADLTSTTTNVVERWCNQVAAEFLVPVETLRGLSLEVVLRDGEIERLARRFKVSTLVILRRIYYAGILGWEQYRKVYVEELDRILRLMEDRAGGGGGNFYNTQRLRVSKRFARSLIISTLEGETLYRDAFQLLGFKKVSTFHELATRLGVR
ncbi:MAG: ImmA/IrrE family metallo-endopeptidase [Firmicutes bacterium]|nr:ImmA/IrrE family metallo-endopeptidase [Bacillota bacterium]